MKKHKLKLFALSRRKEDRAARHKSVIRRSIEKAGWTVDAQVLKKRIFNISVALNVLIGLYFVFRYGLLANYPIGSIAVPIALIWFFLFFVVWGAAWLAVYAYLDLSAYRRRVAVEEVLPDYLQLTSANLRAGMTPDRALWFSIRPQFGVLSDEIQTVAKEVMTGENLSTALRKFSDKYDSVVLSRTVSLLIEGMDAGGDLADIISKVATTIQDARILRKEMAANIITYVIFISAAVMVAAPVLLALSHHLLLTLGNVVGSIDLPSGAQSTGLLTITSVSIKPADFQLFSLIMLITTGLFSAMIISIIQNGTIQAGLKYIPIFILTSLLVYWIALNVVSGFLGIFVV